MEIGTDNDDIVLNTTGLPVFTLKCTCSPARRARLEERRSKPMTRAGR